MDHMTNSYCRQWERNDHMTHSYCRQWERDDHMTNSNCRQWERALSLLIPVALGPAFCGYYAMQAGGCFKQVDLCNWD